MAKVSQGIKLKYAKSKNENAKYKLTYKKVIKTETRIVNGKPTKYTYTTYEKVITPKKQSLSYSKG